jgi:hypothetical protein
MKDIFMTTIPPGNWPPNVTLHPNAQLSLTELQRQQFDRLAGEIFAARAREMREDYHPSIPNSDHLVGQLMAIPAANSDQLGHKLRLFSVELAKEAEFGQNPDFRLIPFFASIQSDCIRLFKIAPDLEESE